MIGRLTPVRSLLRWRTLRWPLAAAVMPVMLWACNGHTLEAPVPAPETETDLVYEANPVRQLDLLFMIDNSGSMAEEQMNLATNFREFMTELQKIDGGIPDTHIAIISSDFGAGVTTISTCHPLGDRGSFQAKAGCNLNAGATFIKTDKTGQENNFSGDLTDVFACMAKLGTSGCGYEHQLQSVRAALEPMVNPAAAEFLRPEAYLGIVLITDEDDCSADPPATFYGEELPEQAASLRCATKGHVCNDKDVPAAKFSTALANCRPSERPTPTTEQGRQQKLINVSEFVEYVRGRKFGRPDKVLVSAITGWSTAADAKYEIDQVTVQDQGGGSHMELDYLPICRSNNGAAAAAIRLKSFVDAFEDNGHMYDICQPDLRAAMTAIGKELAAKLANTCVTSRIVDTDTTKEHVQADCQVIDQKPKKDGSHMDVPLPHCDAGSMPCWHLVNDEQCDSGFRVKVDRSEPPPPGTLQQIKCLTCTAGRKDDANRCVVKGTPP